jgi:hypothetical protein
MIVLFAYVSKEPPRHSPQWPQRAAARWGRFFWAN